MPQNPGFKVPQWEDRANILQSQEKGNPEFL